MRYLLDTDICIYLIKKRPVEAFDQFARHATQDVAISIITLFELEYGVQKSRYRQQSKDALSKFILPLTIVDLDRSAVVEAAAIRSRLEKKGQPIGPYDVLIAGIARSRDLTLVTNNVKEFERIEGLRVENWVA